MILIRSAESKFISVIINFLILLLIAHLLHFLKFLTITLSVTHLTIMIQTGLHPITILILAMNHSSSVVSFMLAFGTVLKLEALGVPFPLGLEPH